MEPRNSGDGWQIPSSSAKALSQPVGIERIGLSAGPVGSEHRQPRKALSERMPGQEWLELTKHSGVLANASSPPIR